MRLAVAATALTILTACTPPPLTAPVDAGGDVAGDVSFPAVAEILRNDCTGNDCHGEAARAGFGMTNGPRASDKQVRQALEGQTVEGEDAKFIVPNKPRESVLFQSLKALNDRQQMPLTGRLEENKIAKIRAWIARGASYE